MPLKTLGGSGKGSLLVDDLGATDGSAALVVTGAGSAPIPTVETGVSNGSVVAVAPATAGSAFIIRPANQSRRGAAIANTSGQILYVSLGATTPTANLHTVAVAAGGYYEVPFGFRGTIRGLVASGTGAVNVTELTA